MAFKRMKPVRRAASAPVESQLPAELRRAAQLINRKLWDEAAEILENLHRRYPNRKEPLQLLLDVAHESEDMVYYDEIIERLLKLVPDNPDYILAQAGATLTNGYLALALERFRHFLQRWPDHEQAPKARETLETVEELLTKTMDEAGLHQENRFELGARNDSVQAYIAQRRYPEARKIAEQMLESDKLYAPALNNLALTYLLEGEAEKSRSYSERVLEFESDNVHALGNLARSLLLLGRKEAAAQAADRMVASKAFAAGKSGKIAETLSFLGDDAGVLAVYARAQKEKDPSLDTPMMHHLAAAAVMRMGQEDEARQFWKEALRLDPDFSLAKENLADLKLPVGERNAPWAFSFGYWIQRESLRDLGTQMEAGVKSSTEDFVQSALHVYLEKHPYIATLVPILLERGDIPGRQFALFLAKTARTPEMLAALCDFAQSQHGPDKLRMDAANLATQEGALDRGKVRLWVRGEWQEVLLMDWELHDEVKGSHAPRVEKLIEEATEAMYAGDGKRSEKLLKQALEIEPKAPDILNNLANAYRVQGRTEEATELMLQIFDRFPDYFFGIINIAHLWREAGQLEDSERLLKTLLEQKRLHFSEFAALAYAEIELLLAKGEEQSARQWYDMWKQAMPDHPQLAHVRPQFENSGTAKSGIFSKLLKRR